MLIHSQISIKYLKKPFKNNKKTQFRVYFNKKITIIKGMRIFDIIKSEINSDKLKVEEEIERVINDKTLDTNNKVAIIKNLLKEVAIIESSFEKFKSYIDDDDLSKLECDSEFFDKLKILNSQINDWRSGWWFKFRKWIAGWFR